MFLKFSQTNRVKTNSKAFKKLINLTKKMMRYFTRKTHNKNISNLA